VRPEPRPPSPSRPPLWTFLVLAALLAIPGVGVPVAIGGFLALAIGRRLVRAATGRRPTERAREPTGAILALGRDDRHRLVELTDRQLSAHTLILGASGAGKSTTLLTILADAIERGRPVVALDLKGSPAFADALARAAARAGRSFQLWSPDGPAHWNPLGHGNPTELKDKLIATERFTEPHYQRAAERYLQTVLTVLAAVRPGRAPTLAEVVALAEPRRLSLLLRRAPEALRTRTQDYLSELTADQLSAIRGLGTRLAIMTESHLGAFLVPAAQDGQTDIDLRRALRGDGVVLFSLNSSSYGKLAAQIGTMVVQDLVSAAGARLSAGAHPGGQAMVGIDEFSALDGDQLVSLFARGREAGVSVLVATQEMADLVRAGATMRDQVLGNTAVKIAHRQDVPDSARLVARLAGTHWVPEDTRQTGPGSLRGLTPRGTRRMVERYLVHPNEITSLRTGEAVLITKLPRTAVRVMQVTARRGGGRASTPAAREGPEL
jgi:conjugal transfer pilus assembly protein TraD